MSPDQQDQLMLRRLPGRLTAEQAAIELGFADHDIAILVAEKCLTPLGQPVRNSVKYFSAVEIRKRAEDTAWLARATAVLQKHWQRRGRKTNGHYARA